MKSVYDDFINTRKVHPIEITSYEIGWHLKDVNDVLQWLSVNDRIVLGGDIIDSQKNYTYDNWFYNYNRSLSFAENVKASIAKAQNYVSNYLNTNGENYFAVLVLN